MNTLRNKVNLIGRIGKNPELQTVGIPGREYTLTRLSIAINERYKDKTGEWRENTQWYNLIAWGKIAERIVKIVQKGQEIMVEGKIVNKSYEKEGEKKYTTDIEVTDFLMLSSKNKENAEENPVVTTVKSSK